MEESGGMADFRKEPKLSKSDEPARPLSTDAPQRSTDIGSGRAVPKRAAKTKTQVRGKVQGKHRKWKKSKKAKKAATPSDDSSSEEGKDSKDSSSSSENDSDSDSNSESDSSSEDEANGEAVPKSRRGKRRADVRVAKNKSKLKRVNPKPRKNPATSDSDTVSSSSTSVASISDNEEDKYCTTLGVDDVGGQLQALQLQVDTLQQYLAQRTMPQQAVAQNQLLQQNMLQQMVPQSSVPNSNVGYQPSYGALSQPNPTHLSNTRVPTVIPPGPPAPIPLLGRRTKNGAGTPQVRAQGAGERADLGKDKGFKDKKNKTPDRPEFKRVDWVWDSAHYNFKLQDTAETSSDSQYDGFVFHVRRTFDVNGKFRRVFVDIKSKLLRECLQDVIGTVQGVSLVDETPKLDPNMLFLYLDDFRSHLKALKELKPAGETKKERRKNQTRLDDKRKHLKVLIRYLDSDYAKIKESLQPMLKNGLITYDLLWALWKPGTLVYSPTYGSTELGRVFRVEAADRHVTMAKGDFYYIDGKYFEFDGKRFGYGNVAEDIAEFRGARKITSLSCYPLTYCKDETKIRQSMIERGKKFVSLSGMHYRAYAGMAYMKRKKGVVRFNIQGSRIMVDPSTFRRMNPNYYVSPVRPEERATLSMGDSSDDDSNGGGGDSSDDGGDEVPKYVSQVVKHPDGNVQIITIPKNLVPDSNSTSGKLDEIPAQNGRNDATEGSEADKTPDEDEEAINRIFSDDDYLITSPVVLGFCFAEKQWLEFEVSCVSDIKWNDQAWDSLVLEPKTKDLIKALVVSRKYSAANTIDDVIQGKGKGLVTVLHGPPGTGKTLTAEGISEMLKCPLYMASAGELGTDSRYLEHELQKILDICHAWGAILLLDEADVFLEKRNMQDIHRNALVSIFLRQLEYFQGILFLTTNRVETFDEAFQSRIHIALRYDKLDTKAKKAIFKMFIERVRAHGKLELEPFEDAELSTLAKHDLNGREIKNILGSAQDLAVSKSEPLGPRHVRQVLDVHDKFGRDLKGGSGFEDAMRSYF